nr:tetraspanin-31-like [Dromaius novaehollandiae]
MGGPRLPSPAQPRGLLPVGGGRGRRCPSPQLVGLLLIGVAAWGKGFGIVSSIHIIGGVIAVGFFLLLIAIVGLIGAIHHHQVMLFFYMIILGLVFVFQFGVSCSCLAINRSRQEGLFSSTWPILSNKTKTELEKNLDCCGLLNSTADFQTFQAEDVTTSETVQINAIQ